jgi:carboxymethylenebutenolidase
MNDQITIEGRDGAFAAYIARLKTMPAPAVVVLQELFGVNADIRKHCDELAEQDYLALAPDLYLRQVRGAPALEVRRKLLARVPTHRSA